MLELSLNSSIDAVPAGEWDALVGEHDSPFVEHTWLAALEEARCVGPHAGWVPVHVTVRDAGRLVAAAPAYVKDNSEGEFIFDWSWAELAHRLRRPYYPKLVVAVPFTPATGARVLTAPGEDRAPLVAAVARALRDVGKELGVHSVHALFPPEDEARIWEGAGYARRATLQYHFHNEGFASWEAFLATLPSKKRTQLRREVKQPAKDGVTIARLRDDEYTPEMVKAMHVFYRATVDKFMWGRPYLNPRFMHLVAERFRSRLAWVVARDASGKPIAGAFNLEKGKRLYGRYWGATVEMPFLHFNVCYYHGIQECIARGLEVFEPGAGGEHKRVRGFRPTMMSSAHAIFDERMRGVIEPHVAREREAVEALIARGGDEDEPEIA